MRRLHVRTPELVPLEFTVASVADRALAYILDALVILIITIVLGTLLSVLTSLTGGLLAMPVMAVMTVAGFLIDFGYRVWTEYRWNGRTIGKRVCGIRVVQQNGTPIHGWQTFVRNLARPLDMLPFLHLVGLTLIAFDPLARRVGDRLAGTVVVQDRTPKPPKGLRVIALEQNSLREDASVRRRVRARVSAREAAVLTEFTARASRLDPARRIALAGRLADHYRVRLGLDDYRGLPDDAILRGIVGVTAADRFAAATS